MEKDHNGDNKNDNLEEENDQKGITKTTNMDEDQKGDNKDQYTDKDQNGDKKINTRIRTKTGLKRPRHEKGPEQ